MIVKKFICFICKKEEVWTWANLWISINRFNVCDDLIWWHKEHICPICLELIKEISLHRNSMKSPKDCTGQICKNKVED